MQVFSGPIHKPTVRFEAPPSSRLPDEMMQFVMWFNDTAPGGKTPLSPLTRAGIAHLYFVCIHPFEDGNGRIGRALAEKSLAQNLGQPSLIALAYTIERKRNEYYASLERNNKETEITSWLKYFANTILEAQKNTVRRVDFYIAKAKFYEKHRGTLNERQEKGHRPDIPRRHRRLQGRLERRELYQHNRNVPCHGDKRFAGPNREGRIDQDRRAAPHPVSP
jgi:Fic family protein